MSTQRLLLGKPSGIPLEHHEAHVIAEALAILEAFPFLAEKYARLTCSDLKAHVLAAAKDHDLGKAHPLWQAGCWNDYMLYCEWRRKSGRDPKRVDADDYRAYEQAVNSGGLPRPTGLLRSGIRHEMASLEKMRNRSNETYVAVAAHHGKLASRFENRWLSDGVGERSKAQPPFAKTWKEFKKAGDKFSKGRKDERLLTEVIRGRYRFDVPRALLQLADTRASRMESLGRGALPKFESWSFEWPFPSYKPVQKLARECAKSDDWVSILRAPTGSGKTAAALLWADHQIKRQRADRLVVAMPTRFTSNALAKSAEDLVGTTGLYHSSAFFNRYGELDTQAKAQAREPHLLAQKLITPVTVCTVDHLLISLTGAREHHHSTLAFMAHAAVVFDEADFYDGFVQANIRFLLDALRALEVPVLIMSATVPESAGKYYGVPSEIIDADEEEAAAQAPPRRKVCYGGEVALPPDAHDHLVRMLRAGNGIVYANTIARAMAYYEYLRKLQAKYDPKQHTEIVLYHSRFTEPHKKLKEERLLELLGAEAWEQGRPQAIAILTQIGEMSVNISTSNMLSEACPWDRLSQRIGRLNRFRESENLSVGQLGAECVVVAPMKDGRIYPAPYGEYKRGEGWQVSQPLEQTVSHLRSLPAAGVEITPSEMTAWVNKLYPEPEEPSIAARANLKSYEHLLRESVIVLPDIRSDDDQAKAFDWSARQIGAQATVLTVAATRMARYSDWQEHKLLYGLEVPVYMVDKDTRLSNQQLSKCTVEIGWGDDPSVETYYYAAAGEEGAVCDLLGREVYNAELGLFGLYQSSDSKAALSENDFGDA